MDCATGKECYSFRQAREVINDARKNCHINRHHKIPVRAYHCDVCGQWHVTKQSH